MSLTGHRKESLRIERMDIKDNLKGDYLFAGNGLRIETSNGAEIRSGGTLDVTDDSTDWLQTRLKITYIADGVEYPRGVFIPSTPTGSRASGGGARQVELYDKTLVLLEDTVSETYVVNKGVTVTTKVREIIISSGETNIQIEESGDKTQVQTTWDPGTSKLQIVNDLLESLNYTKLEASPEGALVSVPSVPYEKKSPSWDFNDDNSQGIYMDDFEDEQDYFRVPNRWIGLSRSDGEEPSLRVVIENNDPDSPLSIPSRGRVITRVSEDVEATSLAVLTAIIQGNLINATNASRKFVIVHPYVPLNVDDVVTFKNTEFGINVKCRITKQEEDFTLPGALVTTTMREVGRG